MRNSGNASKKILERYWKGPTDLADHEVVGAVIEEIRRDICTGRVFPTLRENEIHLYHAGGRVLRITPCSAYSHSKYAKGFGTSYVPLPKPLTKEQYEQLKTRCSEHNRQPLKSALVGHKETWIVSRLFKRFSVWSDSACPSQPKLIDIEVRLRQFENHSVEMVDLLFQTSDLLLIFVEVKRQYDDRVRSASVQKEPEVVNQIRGYEATIQQYESDVLCAYHDVGSVLSNAFGLVPKGFRASKSVFHRVPVLVCRRDKEHGQDVWLKTQLAYCERGEVHPCYLIADGGAVTKTDDKYRGKQPNWCKDGMWENLDLAMLFDRIRGAS